MKLMQNRLKSYVKSNQLFESTSKLLIATSGGVDSIVLCHLLSESKYDITIAHCNFQLRGIDSDKDENFTNQFASELKIPFFSKKFDTKAYSKTHKVSIQIAARNIRYQWFEELVKEHQFDYIVTAHHASDQTETVLYNITKGCGISGLRGIPLKNGNIVRPLLFATKEDVINYAHDKNLTWREDKSNQENKYSKNLIRNQIVPELKKINAGIEETMLRNVERYKSIETYIYSEATKIKSKYLSQTGEEWTLNLEWYSDENKVLLQHILDEFGFNYFQFEKITQSIHHSGKKFYNESYQLFIDRNQLFISLINKEDDFEILVSENDKEIEVSSQNFIFTVKKNAEVKISKNSQIATLDYNKIYFPMTVRNWKEGDRFTPLGMKSEKKLSDFMIDEKIPLNLKKRLPIFVSNKEIFWISGYRINDKFKVTDTTKEVLIIEIKAPNA